MQRGKCFFEQFPHSWLSRILLFYKQRLSSFPGVEGWGDGELIQDSGEAEREIPYQGTIVSWGMGRHHCLGQMLWDIRNDFFFKGRMHSLVGRGLDLLSRARQGYAVIMYLGF